MCLYAGLGSAIVIGHSLGSAYATYIAHRDVRAARGRVAGVVLIDPIAVNLHHSRTTREVIYTRLDSAQASFEDFLFKKELFTSILITRHLPWHEVRPSHGAHEPGTLCHMRTLRDPLLAPWWPGRRRSG